MDIMEVHIPTGTLKELDDVIEQCFRTILSRCKDYQFTYKCDKCDKIHHASVSNVVILGIMQANLDAAIKSLVDDSEGPAIVDLYKMVIAHLYRGHTNNAALIREELVKELKRAEEGNMLPAEIAKIAGITYAVMVPEIEDWTDGTAS